MNKLIADGKMKKTTATAMKKRIDSDLIKLDTTIIIKIYFDTLTLCVKFLSFLFQFFFGFGFNFY